MGIRDHAASAHGNIYHRALTGGGVTGESDWEIALQAIVNSPIFFHADITYTPLEKAESKATKLALEWIDIEETKEFFAEANLGHPPDEFAGTPRAFYWGHTYPPPPTPLSTPPTFNKAFC
jgi:hypothetical protein